MFADVGTIRPGMEPAAGTGVREFLDACLAKGVFKPVDRPAQLAAWVTAYQLGAAWAGFLQEHPVVLSPVCCERPWVVGEDIARIDEIAMAMRMVVPVNILGLPACAVPVGSDDGLPQGVQLIGARFREDLLLDAAQAIEDRAPLLTPIQPRVAVTA
jgi:amidase